MSFLDKVFGKKRTPPTLPEAIQRLREIEDMLVKKQEYLEIKIEEEHSSAKKNATKNKSAALHFLKRKKRYEKQLQQIDNTLTTLEMQREALEVANTNTTVLKTMRNAADILKRTHTDVNVDQVYNLMDEIADQHELTNEIMNAISNPVGFNEDMDEDELMKELESLEDKDLEDNLLSVPGTYLPSVPVEKIRGAEASKASPSKSADKDKEELSKLEQWAL